ncbi:Transcription factor SPT20 homolog [Geodia barretti]|uniref:Transcription factor SPT20 homolog n=1 Tax=Geodia barretti TaxID=519541 RepID=A0AA35S5V2_GEOBA|nr:Transcription factor SPT20 homolog [Geodia barretti]
MDCDSERVWKIVDNQRHNVPRKKRAPGAPLSLFDRLYDCYVDCVQRQNDKNFDKRFCNTSNLLHQLPPGHVQPSLVVNLYSDDRGYSLVLNPDEQCEEICLPYEDDEIFSYLDNQEIPPVLTEVLSETSYCHMHGGCVVCEVRNHRNPAPCPTPSAPQSYDSHLLMLRPTTEVYISKDSVDN